MARLRGLYHNTRDLFRDIIMWEWIAQNAQALNVATSVATVFVWIFYANLLLSGFRRQRQARVLINQGWGNQINSVCLVSNMSLEPIYIQCIFISLYTEEEKFRSSITDFDEVEPHDSQNTPGTVTRQGPLLSGHFMNLGTFRTLIRQAVKQNGLNCNEDDPMPDVGLEQFMITVICTYGPEGEAIGIQRTFKVEGSENQRMHPTSIYSHRLTNKRARRKMERWISEAT